MWSHTRRRDRRISRSDLAEISDSFYCRQRSISTHGDCWFSMTLRKTAYASGLVFKKDFRSFFDAQKFVSIMKRLLNDQLRLCARFNDTTNDLPELRLHRFFILRRIQEEDEKRRNKSFDVIATDLRSHSSSVHDDYSFRVIYFGWVHFVEKLHSFAKRNCWSKELKNWELFCWLRVKVLFPSLSVSSVTASYLSFDAIRFRNESKKITFWEKHLAWADDTSGINAAFKIEQFIIHWQILWHVRVFPTISL